VVSAALHRSASLTEHLHSFDLKSAEAAVSTDGKGVAAVDVLNRHLFKTVSGRQPGTVKPATRKLAHATPS
jgi:hypothetical protein